MVYFGERHLAFSLEFVLMNIQVGGLCKWANDTQCFLLEHFDIIHESPSKIYYSALPLCPSSSWLYGCYTLKSKEVRVVKGLLAEWGKCSRTVALSATPLTISYWNTTIAAGLESGDIVILDAITGSCTAILSGHDDCVRSVTFSSDGKLFVSGSDDKIVKLWDVQTGGIVQDFSRHNHYVFSVSVSADSAIIASGSYDKTIRLWDVSTGECHNVIEQDEWVHQVSFSPMAPKQLVARLGNNTVSCWDVNGCKIGPTYNGSYIGISLDGKQFALCNKNAITVQTFETSATVAKFHVKSGAPYFCCFSPDGKLIAAAVGNTAYVWDISSSDSQPIKTFIGHTGSITALVFYSPSSLISASIDNSVKFWQISTLSTDPVETNLSVIPSPSHEVVSTTLQAKDGVVITSDSDGTVRVLDILTGLCKASFQTPAADSEHKDGQFINGRLIFAWNVGKQIQIHGAREDELILELRESDSGVESLRIVGDGCKIFSLGQYHIQAWSTLTGEVLGEVEIEDRDGIGSLVIDGSKVWAYYPGEGYQGWDFGILGSLPTHLLNIPPSKLHPSGSMLWDWDQSKVQDVVTGRVVFQLPKTFEKPIDVQWDNQSLFICYGPTKVLILDFSYFLA